MGMGGRNAQSILWGLFGLWRLRSESGVVLAWSKRPWAEAPAGSDLPLSDNTEYGAPDPRPLLSALRDELSLIGANGEIMSFALAGVDLECRDGHKVTMISARPLLRSGECCVAVRNHTTGKTFFSEQALRRIFQPSALSLAIAASLLALPLIGFELVDGVIVFGIALLLTLSLMVVGIRRLRRFKRNTPFAE